MISLARTVPGALALAALVALGACARRDDGAPRAGERVRLPVDVIADSGASVRWTIRPPAEAAPGAPERGVTGPGVTGADVWLARVEPARAPALSPPLPGAAPETLAIGPGEPPRLEVDEDLKPPILRRARPLLLPPGARPASVELDVRVDEEGRVSDAEWAGGSADSALVRAATDCALAMEFFPALQGGRRVAVWCRQRFDFSRR